MFLNLLRMLLSKISLQFSELGSKLMTRPLPPTSCAANME
jgi:hypothetical protein